MVKTSIVEGQPAPDFCLPDQNGDRTCLDDFRGKWIVLYFYPKDNTPGCSLEAKEFSCLEKEFETEHAIILGVSKDSLESHKRFIEKKELTIKLLSDKQAEVHKAYDVLHPKRIRGKEVTGTMRTTFLIDPAGKTVRVWNNVKASGHAEKVLSELKSSKRNKI